MTRPDSVIRYRLLSDFIKKVKIPFAINFFEKCYECKSGFEQSPYLFYDRQIITTACFKCYIALDNVNFKPLQEVCSFCKYLMQKYSVCSISIPINTITYWDDEKHKFHTFTKKIVL